MLYAIYMLYMYILVLFYIFFQSANLLGVKMLCVNLEGASLKGCNFEDPAGSRANMEGKICASVDLFCSKEMLIVNSLTASEKRST